MSQAGEKGYMDTAIDAVSSAAASVGNAATDLKDRITHLGAAADEKTQEKGAAMQKEMDKETVKNGDAPLGDRVKAAGGVVHHAVDEKVHEAKYEKEKRQATH